MNTGTWNTGHTELLESLENKYGLLRESDYALVADVDDDGVCIGVEGFYISDKKKNLVSVTNPRNSIPLTQITKIRVPDGAKSIARCAFRNFKYLEEIVIPDSVVYIDKDAFMGCNNLKSIDVWKGCTVVDKYWPEVHRHGDSLLFEEGPAGGIVFYDKGSYSDGWRYLEAAPEDIKVGTDTEFVFGFFRTSSSGNNLFVNGSSYVAGTSSATDGNSTGTAVGTGKANTVKLVDKMGAAAYTTSNGSDTTADYAAKLCADCTYGGYSDWFLPSKDELNLMHTNLKTKGLGGFISDPYWSSSEDDYDARGAWYQHFGYGGQGGNYHSNHRRVRPVRAF